MAEYAGYAIAASMAYSAYAQYQAGDFAADIAEYNASLLREQARVSRETAKYEEVRLRKTVGRVKARQRALYAKAGVTFEGSPLEVMVETAGEAEMDALMIRYMGETRAKGMEMEAVSARWSGELQKLTSRIAAGRTILSTGAMLYGMYGTPSMKDPGALMGPGAGYGYGTRGAGYGYK